MGDLVFGLKLAVIGMSVVFSILFGIVILVWVMAKIWGPKQEAPQTQQEKKESKTCQTPRRK